MRILISLIIGYFIGFATSLYLYPKSQSVKNEITQSCPKCEAVELPKAILNSLISCEDMMQRYIGEINRMNKALNLCAEEIISLRRQNDSCRQDPCPVD
jgi:hypothetical protein